MLTRAEGRAQKRAIARDVARDERKRKREELRALKAEIRSARVRKREAIANARVTCREHRRGARARIKDLRRELLAQVRRTLQEERMRAKEACALAKGEARQLGTRVEQARAKLAAERLYRREMRRIEAANRARRRETRAHIRRGEHLRESDDQVLASIPPELAMLWEKVKHSIRGSSHRSRTEAFLHYAEEHPSEVLAVIDDRTDALIAELEARERSLSKSLRRSAPAPRAYDDVPF